MRALPMRKAFSFFFCVVPISLSLSLSLSLSPLPRPTGGKLFSISKARHYREKNLCFLLKELELAARGGTRKPFRRATRQRRPMDAHVFVSLTQCLGFGHQGSPKFPFGKPHDQKFKKNRPPSIKRQSIFASTIYMFC